MRNDMICIFLFCMLIFPAVFSTTISSSDQVNNYESRENKIQIQTDFPSNTFIVKFKDRNIPINSILSTFEKYDIHSIENIYKNGLDSSNNTFLIHLSNQIDLIEIVEEISYQPDILYVEPNYIAYPFDFIKRDIDSSLSIQTMETNFIPNDPYFNEQWTLHNTGQFGGISDVDIDAIEAWDIVAGNPEIIVAVVDSGIDLSHPDLIDISWVNEDEIADNGIDDDGNGYVDDVYGYNFVNPSDGQNVWDQTGHGTVLSGIIAALTDNGIGIAGIASGCKIMNLKIFDESGGAYISDIAASLKYAADNGAKVICMALGVMMPSSTLRDAVNYAYSKGVFICCAAGNFGNDRKVYPGAFENVTAVAGLDYNNQRMEHYVEYNGEWLNSSYGEWVDIASFGVEIWTTLPTYNVEYMNEIWGHNQNYDRTGGTTSATPIVAGVAALIFSKNPNYSPGKVTAILKATSESYDSEYNLGVGRINAYNSLMEMNAAPEKPEPPIGPSSGKLETSYDYQVSSTDADNDKVYYLIDWGDGNNSGWQGPYNSGETCTISNIWMSKGEYNIKVKCKDIYGQESSWSDPLIVSISRNKIIHHLFYEIFKNLQNKIPLCRFYIHNTERIS